MNKILVTGGAGHVGCCIVDGLIKDPNNMVVVVDNLLTGNLSKVPTEAQNCKFIRCNVNDYSDISSVMLSYQFDYVFHYAAVVGVKRTLDNPVMVLKDIDGIENILNLSKNTGVKRVFYSSSSEVYGEPVEFPQNELTTPLNSRLPYAIVKNVGEAFLKSYQHSYGLDYTIFRFFNTYGPKASTDFVVTKFIDLALQGKDITIYGDGSQTRSFSYVQDTVNGIVSLMESEHNDVFNIGNPNEITINELATKIIETAKKMLKGELILYIDKNKENTEYLLHYYDKKGFKIFEENNIEYKMIYKN